MPVPVLGLVLVLVAVRGRGRGRRRRWFGEHEDEDLLVDSERSAGDLEDMRYNKLTRWRGEDRL